MLNSTEHVLNSVLLITSTICWIKLLGSILDTKGTNIISVSFKQLVAISKDIVVITITCSCNIKRIFFFSIKN